MPNFFTDNKDILFNFEHLDIDKVVKLVENDFEDKDKFDYAPHSVFDAKDSYNRVLTMLGEICGETIEPLAAEVDEEEAHFEDGKVTYAKGTQIALELLSKAELMGFTLPRKYGGINFPVYIYVIAIELVSRADGALMNLFGLQDIGETINEFADEDIKQKYLPRFASGESTGAMDLTEPDAGSDLQAVRLKAWYDEDNKTWRLNGVKRFITNGCADISLVLARSEEGTTDGRGLSMFLCEKDDTLIVRRIEEKLGIHGSPTCELQFNDTPALLIGRRRFGLIKYVMSLMNGARLAIAAQGLGIAEAAYHEGLKYAREREQFGKSIINFPAVYEMLMNSKVCIEAARVLTYKTAIYVDIKKGLERKLETDRKNKELKTEYKKMDAITGLLTPLSKLVSTELANKVAYDSLQIHGGTGFTKDFNIERHYRDARITNIYEGTTQLQVVAAIGGVTTKVIEPILNKMYETEWEDSLIEYNEILKSIRDKLNKTIDYVLKKDDSEYLKFHSRRLVETLGFIYQGYLLLEQANKQDRKKVVAKYFINAQKNIVSANLDTVLSGNDRPIVEHKIIIDE